MEDTAFMDSVVSIDDFAFEDFRHIETRLDPEYGSWQSKFGTNPLLCSVVAYISDPGYDISLQRPEVFFMTIEVKLT